MSDDPSPRNDSPNRRNQEPQFNWKGFLLLAVAVLLVGSALILNGQSVRSQEITYKDFKKIVEEGLIDRDKNLVLIQRDGTSKEVIEGFRFEKKVDADRAAQTPTPVITSPSVTTEAKPASLGPVSVKFSVPVSIQYQKEELQKMLDRASRHIRQS